ncbi:hypothetical protein FB567DRAFT_516346 [Paraphoma chrysanthemicola]|uniref:CorA-like transporter domain-containing protein n=1 Tax=Paraphoma chrysanthemicola TaxID=798071 RepID=A0A8K0RDX9_9PLEO|nr:hypothetical protein FB567DRAFT_516346 [Paraphoma chrysanthemicola]
MSDHATNDNTFSSILDIAAGSSSLSSDNFDRCFIVQDSGWNLPVFCLAQNKETDSDLLQPQSWRICEVLRDAVGLRSYLDDNARRQKVELFIIQQKISWSRFEISKNGFQEILGQGRSYGPLIDLITSFGVKYSSRADDFTVFHCRGSDAERNESYELCYNIRYMYRHGRKDEYPWSVRHTAVYQQKSDDGFSSRWIFFQPPGTVQSSLARVFGDPNLNKTNNLIAEPLFVHLLLLVAVESSWRLFIAELEGEIEILSDKALYSRVGRPSKTDYQVTFVETQQMQRIRQRLLKTQKMLEMTLKTLRALQRLFDNKKGTKHNRQMIGELDGLVFRYESHCVSIERLMGVADGTTTLLMKILDFRNDENIRLNLSKTRELLVAAEQESLMLNGITQQTQQDSRSMKIVTFIALVFLPGTLVASVYSSNIVQSDERTYGFVPGRQLLSFLVITASLTIVTLATAIIWNRRACRAPKRSATP